jgi:hypothetical protein
MKTIKKVAAIERLYGIIGGIKASEGKTPGVVPG